MRTACRRRRQPRQPRQQAERLGAKIAVHYRCDTGRGALDLEEGAAYTRKCVLTPAGAHPHSRVLTEYTPQRTSASVLSVGGAWAARAVALLRYAAAVGMTARWRVRGARGAIGPPDSCTTRIDVTRLEGTAPPPPPPAAVVAATSLLFGFELETFCSTAWPTAPPRPA